MESIVQPKGRPWLMLVFPPFLFLILIVIASILVGVAVRGDPALIPAGVQRSIPYILLAAQVILLLVLTARMQREGLHWADLGWQLPAGSKLAKELAIGMLAGSALAVLYLWVLSPLITSIQKSIGDYVPAGELLPTLGSALLPFFAANVLLAPFVEENIYRGYAFLYLDRRYGSGLAAVITCFFFGLLHWTGGFWYMLLTGALAGGLFVGLRIARKNLVAPYSAHLTLNCIEFLFIWLG